MLYWYAFFCEVKLNISKDNSQYLDLIHLSNYVQ